MSWTLKPGIRQDSRGRLYQVATNSRGKEDIVFVQPTDAPPARMIPVVEPQRRMRQRLLIIKGTDMSQRRMRVEYRVKGESEIRTVQDTAEVVQAFVDQHRAVCGLRKNKDTGAEELDVDFFGNCITYLFPGNWNWFMQYHITLKEVS